MSCSALFLLSSSQDIRMHVCISVSSCNLFVETLFIHRFFFFSSHLPPFWSVADAVFSSVSVWLLTITVWVVGLHFYLFVCFFSYKRKKKFMTSSNFVNCIFLITFRSFFFTVCCHLLPTSCKCTTVGTLNTNPITCNQNE